jgi:predicted alpha-1,6-mannanase (GH76 family)
MLKWVSESGSPHINSSAVCCAAKGSSRNASYALSAAAVLIVSLPVVCVAQTIETESTGELREHASVGVRALQSWYSNGTGLYETTGWWNSANAITVLDNYMELSHSKEYLPILDHTFSMAQLTNKNFFNNFYDDEGWWALAWLGTYDLTKNPKYLAMAEVIFTDMEGGWSDDVCGGGIWWSKGRQYKNAIANELFLSVAAHLANRVADPKHKGQYLSWASREWKWFSASGMVNAKGLINDGLVSKQPSACVNNGLTTWSYNQGVILGGLTELATAEKDRGLLDFAHGIAAAAMHQLTDTRGILHDECEPNCGKDGVQFKGIFLRNLAELEVASPRPEYEIFAENNAASIWVKSQDDRHRFGQVWSGPFDAGNAGSQSSALDAVIAAAEMDEPRAAKTFQERPRVRHSSNEDH